MKLKFGNGTRAKVCGEYGTITSYLENNFFDDPGGIIEIYIIIDHFKPLVNVHDTLDISIVFTAYGGTYFIVVILFLDVCDVVLY